MKTLAVIPTKGRINSAVQVAMTLSPEADETLIFAQGYSRNELELHEGPEYKIWDRISDGIHGQRNAAIRYAIDQGFDTLLMNDDDLIARPELVSKLMKVRQGYPNLGMVSAYTRVQAHWSKDVRTNQPYRIDFMGTQLMALRVDHLKEIADNFDDEPFGTIGTMEDLLISCKYWTLGLPCVRITGPIEYAMNSLVSRTSKTDAQGGQTISERNHLMPLAIEDLQRFVGSDKVIKILRGKIRKNGDQGFYIRYNHEVAMGHVHNRGHNFGYLDNKGRRM